MFGGVVNAATSASTDLQTFSAQATGSLVVEPEPEPEPESDLEPHPVSTNAIATAGTARRRIMFSSSQRSGPARRTGPAHCLGDKRNQPTPLVTASAGLSAIAVPRRLDTTTAATIIASATSEIVMRRPVYLSSAMDSATMAGAISSETRFITLINGLIAGPAVSLNGSPTVSPITVAACASEPLPPWLPSSTSFLALSQAPPELARKIAIRVPVAIAPAR